MCMLIFHSEVSTVSIILPKFSKEAAAGTTDLELSSLFESLTMTSFSSSKTLQELIMFQDIIK